MIPWYRQKTTWTAIAGIVAAVGGYLVGEVTLQAAIAAVIGALSVIFLRQGVEKVGALVLALALVGCAGVPANVAPTAQGAQTLTGQQGQAAETGSATVYANPLVIYFFGSKLTIKATPTGAEVEGDGPTEVTVAGNLTLGGLTYGEESVNASVSSGGGSTAGASGTSTTKTVPPAPSE